MATANFEPNFEKPALTGAALTDIEAAFDVFERKEEHVLDETLLFQPFAH